MTRAYKIVTGLDEFTAAREQFGSIVQHLQSQETQHLEHGAIEQFLWHEGTELLRRLLQGHLDLRYRRESRRDAIVGCDGVERTHLREGCERGLMTLFGEVEVRRKGYGARGVCSVFPLDAELNLPADNYSHGLCRRMSKEVSRHSFDDAVEQVDKTTGGKVPKRQAQALAKEVSRDFEAFYEGRSLEAAAKRHDVAVTITVDFIHVLEYVWKAAYCFHGSGTQEAEQWVGERALRILHGKSSDVAAGMRRSATLQGLSSDDRAAVDDCADYLLKYRKYLRYDENLRRGLPIATGVIEGACRHLVNDRMEITGARWGLHGAEAILKLRSLRSSGDLDEYWKFHRARALERNHASRYANRELPKAA